MTPKSSGRLKSSSCPVPCPLLLLLCAGLVFCSGDTLTQPEVRDSGRASVAIGLGKVVSATLSRVEVVITGSDMDEIRQDLTISGNRATGTVRGIPAGAGRLFTLNGYDSSGGLAYAGSATADVIAGEQVTVRITMRRVGAPVGKPRLQVASSASAQRGLSKSIFDLPDITRINGEIDNTGDGDATNLVIDLRARNSSGAAISDSRVTIGTVKAGDSKLFSADFSGTSQYKSLDPEIYVSSADYTVSYNEGDPISGRITIPE